MLLDYGRNAKVVTLASVAVISVLVGIIGLLRDRMITQTYGIGIEADTFYLGLALPMYLAGILNALTQTAAMPSFVKLIHNKDDALRAQFAGAVLLLNLCLAGVVSLGMVVWVAMGAPGMQVADPQQLRMVELMGVGLCVLTAGASLFVTMLQARGYIKLITAVNGIPSLVCMVYLWLYGGSVDGALWAFLGGYVLLAGLAMLVVLRSDALSFPKPQGGWKPTFDLVFRQYGVLAVGVIFFNANLTVNQIMSTHFGEGQLTAYTLGTRVPLFLAGLISTAITAVLLHEFSHIVARKDYAHLMVAVRRYEKFFLFGVLAGILPLALVSTWILEILFGTGDGASMKLAGMVFAASLFHLPFFAVGNVYVRALGALHSNKIISLLSVIGCGVNVLLNLMFSYFWGIIGIAMVTTVVYLMSCAVFRWHLQRCVNEQLRLAHL